MARSGLNKIEFTNRTHWVRILMRIVLSVGLLLLSIIIVALLRTACSLSTALISLFFLVAINIHAVLRAKKKQCCIYGDHLIIDEYFVLNSRVHLDVPISMIDNCVLVGLGPYLSVKLSVHGRSYTLRNMRHAAEIVEIINDRMKE